LRKAELRVRGGKMKMKVSGEMSDVVACGRRAIRHCLPQEAVKDHQASKVGPNYKFSNMYTMAFHHIQVHRQVLFELLFYANQYCKNGYFLLT
jgi:hypothetical protein